MESFLFAVSSNSVKYLYIPLVKLFDLFGLLKVI